ncbi:hypothetical protein BDV30DRAFT_238090 [Aspergillus minisclerotigenes]|uniref:Uncharacterized protein n=1 Tax=Aspergillus minisclerotigenes TaxID=656917 RepID=A0A5N6J737_9EURO|nr:hypothetical protein BDV30DRAFT_238090 [Aspergillus minisclerotigenes]
MQRQQTGDRHKTRRSRVGVKTDTPSMKLLERITMNIAIQEALTCTTCTIDPPAPTSGGDPDSEIDGLDEDVSFATEQRAWREESPLGTVVAAGIEEESLLTTPTPAFTSGYERLMTPSQIELYEERIDRFISQDPDRDKELARYYVDYHIHVHYMSHRGMLSLCRDNDDRDELKKWMWGLRKYEEIERMAGKSDLQIPDFSIPDKVPWPDDCELMEHEEGLWRKWEPSRQRQVQRSKFKWKKIMKEREKQRQAQFVQLRLAHQKCKVQKVNIYWGRGILREVALDSPW